MVVLRASAFRDKLSRCAPPLLLFGLGCQCFRRILCRVIERQVWTCSQLVFDGNASHDECHEENSGWACPGQTPLTRCTGSSIP